MPVTTDPPRGPSVDGNRSAVTIAVLALALAAVLALLVVRLDPGPAATPTPAHSPTRPSTAAPGPAGPRSAAEPSPGQDPAGPSYVPPLQRINEGCMIARTGVQC
jgi:hypothetical protein